MKLTLIVSFVLCICIAGHLAFSAIPDDELSINQNSRPRPHASAHLSEDHKRVKHLDRIPDLYSHVVSRLVNSYRGLVTGHRIDSPGLFLFGAGIVGLLGIRRRFK